MPEPETPPEQTTPPAPEQTPPEPAAGPWAADLPAYFGEDAAAIAAADRYMREKVQPRMTELETGSATARELWTDLNEDPASTVRDLVASIYGDEFAAEYEALFAEEEENPPAETPPASTPADPPDWAKPLVEDYQQRSEREQAEAAQKAYDDAKAELRTAHDDLTDDDMGLIDAFIYSAGGDMEQGYAGYQAFKTKFIQTHGVAPAAGEPTPPTPPPVIGSQGAPAGTPPVARQYTSWDDLDGALEDFMSENRAAKSPPPVIG